MRGREAAWGSAADAEEPEKAAEESKPTVIAPLAHGGAIGEPVAVVVSVAGKAEQENDNGDQAEDQAKSEEEQSGVDQHNSDKIPSIIFRNGLLRIPEK